MAGHRGSGARREAGAPDQAPPWADLLASFTDAVVVTDRAGAIVLFNHAAEELTGVPRGRVLGRPCSDVFAASPMIGEMLERLEQTGQSESRGDAEMRCGERLVAVRVTCLPLWDATGGRIRGAGLVLHDLTYQRTLEAAARRNESLARLGTLIAGLAHEIRNPLAGIKGAAQLLGQRLSSDPDLREYTSVITRETDRLSALTDDLLTLGAPVRPRLTRLNIHQVIRHVLNVLGPELRTHGIQVACEFDPSLPELCGDESQLGQVLLNLLRNALEALIANGPPRPSRDSIVIRTRMETDFHIREPDRASKFLRIEVADSGVGIDPSDASRLFEPFFTTKARGAGLGLAISARIVAEHGGSIRAEPNRPFGTVITVTLPVARTSA